MIALSRTPSYRLAFALLVAAIATGPSPSRAAASPAPSQRECDRACLDSHLDRYLSAFSHAKVATLPLASDVRVTMNNRVVLTAAAPGAAQATVFRPYAIRGADPATGNVGYLGLVDLGGKRVPYGLRLKIVADRISEIETIMPSTSLPDLFYAAAAKLTTARPEFGETVPPGQRSDRDELIAIANSHYEGLEQADSRPVPFAAGCHRIENGMALTNNPKMQYPVVAKDGRRLPNFGSFDCKKLAETGIFDADFINARRFPLVDPERGVVFAFSLYQPYAKAPCAETALYGEVCPVYGTSDSRVTSVLLEVFKISGGLIRAMESIWDLQPAVWRSPWWHEGLFATNDTADKPE